MRIALLSLLALSGQALANPSAGAIEWVDYEEPALDAIDKVGVQPPLGIVNGSVTTEYPNVLALVVLFGGGQGSQFCSATQISDDFVLTAAHCAEAGENYLNQGGTLYIARTNNVYQTPEDGWFQVRGGGVHIHPQWPGMNAQEVIHDVALMQTSTPIVGTGGPAVLNDEPIDSTWFGRELTFVGFGITDDDAQDSGIKRVTSIPVGEVEPGIVYSYDPNTNVCSGDSGGAAFEITPDGLELAGVNSFVFQQDWNSDPCDGGANGAARVDSYLDWIIGIEPDVLTDWAPDPVDTPDPNDPTTGTGDGLTEADDAVTGVGCGCSSTASAPAGLAALSLLVLPLVRRRSTFS
ncbi:MAG: trypsin-like serine protease [Proteobacteria bacterium]|nr:trypsin-like serine protease [Pseudomonadota bacterium]